MNTRATATLTWDDHEDAQLEADRVVTVEDGFERGAALQDLWIRVQSQDLRSGRVTGLGSKITVDLRDATLGSEGATIEVQALFGGVDVLVPPDWEVACEVDAVFGGVGEDWEGRWSAEERPRLRLVGMLVAGGLSVR